MSMNRILESNYLFLERKNEFSRRGPFGTGSCRMSRSPISWPPGWASQEEGAACARAWDAGNDKSPVWL